MKLSHNVAYLKQQLKDNARAQITTRYERQEVWEALLEEYQTLIKENNI